MIKISKNRKKIVEDLVKGWLVAIGIVVICFFVAGIYFLGYFSGMNYGSTSTEETYQNLFSIFSNKARISSLQQTPAPTQQAVSQKPRQVVPSYDWGGPELWEEVNRTRLDYGVGAMAIREELCTIASIRLNELLERGSLDAHEGFSNMPERRPDLQWIFEKYAISEFLVQGAESAREAVDLWEGTLGHRKLLTGGEYVYGCIYAQNSFGVAIAAYE